MYDSLEGRNEDVLSLNVEDLYQWIAELIENPDNQFFECMGIDQMTRIADLCVYHQKRRRDRLNGVAKTTGRAAKRVSDTTGVEAKAGT